MSAQEIAEAAILASAEINTYQFDMDMEMTTAIPGEAPVTMTMDMNGALDMPNTKMYADTQLTMSILLETVQMSMEMYIIGDWMYMKVEMFGLPPEWMKTQMPEEEMASIWEQQDIAYQQHYLLTGFSEVELLGTETVNGVECYKLRVITDMEKLLEWAGVQGELEGLEGLDPEDVITDYSMTQWIAKDTHITIKSITELTMTVEEATTSMTQTTLMHHINEPVTIELPPEAEAAEEVPYS